MPVTGKTGLTVCVLNVKTQPSEHKSSDLPTLVKGKCPFHATQKHVPPQSYRQMTEKSFLPSCHFRPIKLSLISNYSKWQALQWRAFHCEILKNTSLHEEMTTSCKSPQACPVGHGAVSQPLAEAGGSTWPTIRAWTSGLQGDRPPWGRGTASQVRGGRGSPGCAGSALLPRFAQGTQHSPNAKGRGTAASAFSSNARLQLKKQN